MNKLFGKKMAAEKFKKEKRFLLSTLIFFSVSYLTGAVRNMIIILMIRSDEGHDALLDIFCPSNFVLSLYNIGCYLITELIPYTIIFILNYQNFSQIDKQDEYMRKHAEEVLQNMSTEEYGYYEGDTHNGRTGTLVSKLLVIDSTGEVVNTDNTETEE